MHLSFFRLLTPESGGTTFSCLAETLAFPLAAIAIGIWLNPGDPMFIHAAFPWSWLAPLILALRYGPLWGMASAGVLLIGWLGLDGHYYGHAELPKLYFLGGLITTMLAGEFSSVWQARLHRALAVQTYLDQRLDALTRTHYLLRLSHESLEQDLLARPISMRDALVGLRELAAGIQNDRHAPLPAADQLLKLTVQFCQIERAAVVPIEKGVLDTSRTNYLGAAFQILPDDAIVGHALATERLTHIASLPGGKMDDSPYLVAAPIRDTTQQMHAVFIIKTLPFLALQEENLQMLNLMLGYYADSLALSPLVTPLRTRWPDCPSPFALELQRLGRMWREAAVPSAMVALHFPEEDLPPGFISALQRQQRSLDVSWLVQDVTGSARTLLTILPLASTAALEGYLARIERWVLKQYGEDLVGLNIRFQPWQIGTYDSVELIVQALKAPHVPTQTDHSDASL